MAEHTPYTGEEDIFNAIYLKCFQKSLRPLYKSLISPKHSSTLFQQADPDRDLVSTHWPEWPAALEKTVQAFLHRPVSCLSFPLAAAGSCAKSAT